MKILKETWLKIKDKLNNFSYMLGFEIENCFKNLWNYKENYKKIIIYLVILPITIKIIYIYIFVLILSLFIFNIIFLYKWLKWKIFKKKIKTMKFKKNLIKINDIRMEFITDLIIEFPRIRAFSFFYYMWKNIIENKKELIKKNVLKKILTGIIIRYLIIIILGIPFIIINYNRIITNKIWSLKDGNYKNFESKINTIIMNIWFQLKPAESELTKKMKIIFKKKKIIFNPTKKEFKDLNKLRENFFSFKEKINILFFKQKIIINEENKKFETTKKHLAGFLEQKKIIIENKNKEIIYINETSSKKIEKYAEKPIETIIKHKGTINKEKETFFSKPIITTEDKIEIMTDKKSMEFLKKMIDEKVNNIVLGFMLSINQEIYKTEYTKEEEKIKKLNIKKDEENKNLREYLEKNKEKFENELLEKMLQTEEVLLKNKNIIENMTEEEKTLFLIEIKLGKEAKETINFFIIKK